MSVKKITIPISGMHCASCVNTIEEALSSLPGVLSSSVNLATEKAFVEFIHEKTGVDELKRAIEEAGYTPLSVEEEKSEREKEDRILFYRLILSLVLGGGVFLLSMAEILPIKLQISNFILFILATPVQFWGGFPFYAGAWKVLRKRSSDMNTLIAIGTSAAYGYSVVATLFPGLLLKAGAMPEVYYDTSSVIIALVLLGRWLESRAKGKTSDAILRLMALQPKTARLVAGEEERDVNVEEIKKGDIVRVRPGEKIPIDGKIIDGTSTVDESIVTGESIPVSKSIGDNVIGGTINKFGSFLFRVEKVFGETLFSQIVRLVEEASASKAPVQRFADKVASVFVPIVLLIALFTFFIWIVFGNHERNIVQALMAFVSVLIIACPCALGLATPTAIVVGTGKGAENGILFKNAESLERACNITTAIFDKTGTLTNGKPKVTDVISFGKTETDEILKLTASVEKNSEHPLAESIVEKARENGFALLQTRNFEAIPGKGTRASVNGKDIIVGNRELMRKSGYHIDEYDSERIRELEAEGKTIIFVGWDNKVQGAICVADLPKEGTSSAINLIKEMGISVEMLTGDSRRTGETIGKSLGIERIIAEVLPQDKQEIVKNEKAKGEIVAMIGDGINDGPALACADVGIAIGSGTDIAIEAGDITLVSGDLRGVPKAIGLSRKIMRTIKWNLFWAFAYNVIGIPVAAGALYPFFHIMLSPIIASAAMAASSIFVVTNSLRLKRVKL